MAASPVTGTIFPRVWHYENERLCKWYITFIRFPNKATFIPFCQLRRSVILSRHVRRWLLASTRTPNLPAFRWTQKGTENGAGRRNHERVVANGERNGHELLMRTTMDSYDTIASFTKRKKLLPWWNHCLKEIEWRKSQKQLHRSIHPGEHADVCHVAPGLCSRQQTRKSISIQMY